MRFGRRWFYRTDDPIYHLLCEVDSLVRSQGSRAALHEGVVELRIAEELTRSWAIEEQCLAREALITLIRARHPKVLSVQIQSDPELDPVGIELVPAVQRIDVAAGDWVETDTYEV